MQNEFSPVRFTGASISPSIFTGLLLISAMNMGFGVCFLLTEYRGTISVIVLVVRT